MTPKPVRIVHIMTVPYSFTFIKGQVGYMKARGFDVYGLSSPGELLSKFAESEQITVHAVEMTKRITPFRDILALVKIWRWLRSVQPDIVQSHTPKGGFLGMLGAWLAGVPVRIYLMHGLRFATTTGWKRKLLITVEKWTCSLAHRVLCVSTSVQVLAVENGLCPAEKIQVLLQGSCNGVDSSGRFNPDNVPMSSRVDIRTKCGIQADAPVLGFIGRIVLSKGIVELSEAWCSLREEFPNLHLLMIGGAESEDPIPTQVDQLLRSDSRIHLIGEEWNTPPLFAAMDIFVLPTYREGLPIVLLEAAAMKLPVVATRVSGCVDVVEDGITGTLVPPHDAEKLAGAIRNYLKDPDLRRHHGSAMRERVVSDFRQEAIWQALYQEYIQCLSKANPDQPFQNL